MAVMVPERVPEKRLPELKWSKLRLRPMQRTSEGHLRSSEDSIPASSLIVPNGAILFVVRRAGCLIYREQMHDLCEAISQRQGHHGKDYPNVIGILREEGADLEQDRRLRVTEFADQYFCGSVFLDRDCDLFKMMGDRRGSVYSKLSCRLMKKYLSFSASKQKKDGKNHGHSLENEGVAKGGVLVIDASGQVVYSHQEKTLYELPVEEILAALDTLVEVSTAM
eukprot:6172300-Pleurochrysis_carterae.AAC.1